MHQSSIPRIVRAHVRAAYGGLALLGVSACALTGCAPSVDPSDVAPTPMPMSTAVATVPPGMQLPMPQPVPTGTTLTIRQSLFSYTFAGGPTTAMVLYGRPSSAEIFETEHVVDYAYATEGASLIPVAWTLAGDAVSTSTAPPGAVGTPPPGGIELAGVRPGMATLTATTPTQSASWPVFFYPTAFFGCDAPDGVTPAANFDPAPRPSRDPFLADVYVSAPIDINGHAPCSDPTYTVPYGGQSIVHFPYGATIATDGDDPARPVASGVMRGPAFPYVQASEFRNDFTSITDLALKQVTSTYADRRTTGMQFDPSAPRMIPGSILLFKTRAGRIVKLSITTVYGEAALDGPYEVSTDPGGPFAY